MGKLQAVEPEIVTQARVSLLDEEVYDRLAETFRALGDVSRAKILYSLARRELCVGELARALGLSEPAVSQHLRVLRALRLVKHHREGRMVYYSLDDEHIRTLLEVCLEHLAH